MKKCDSCEYRFNCLTTSGKPIMIKGLNFKISGECENCQHTPFSSYYKDNKVAVCKFTRLLTYSSATCLSFEYPSTSGGVNEEHLARGAVTNTYERGFRGKIPRYCIKEE